MQTSSQYKTRLAKANKVTPEAQVHTTQEHRRRLTQQYSAEVAEEILQLQEKLHKRQIQHSQKVIEDLRKVLQAQCSEAHKFTPWKERILAAQACRALLTEESMKADNKRAGC